MSLMGMFIIPQIFFVSSPQCRVKKLGSAVNPMFVDLKVQYCFKESKNDRIKILSTNRRLVVKGYPTMERKMWVKVSLRGRG